MRFAYHMYGAHTGTLRVATSSGAIVFEVSGLNENSWIEIQRGVQIARGEQVNCDFIIELNYLLDWRVVNSDHNRCSFVYSCM